MTIGRKLWLFFPSNATTERAAQLASILTTARLHGASALGRGLDPDVGGHADHGARLGHHRLVPGEVDHRQGEAGTILHVDLHRYPPHAGSMGRSQPTMAPTLRV